MLVAQSPELPTQTVKTMRILEVWGVKPRVRLGLHEFPHRTETEDGAELVYAPGVERLPCLRRRNLVQYARYAKLHNAK